MKKLFRLFALPLLAACTHTTPDVAPIVPAIQGEIVRYQTTFDQHNQNPRTRWIIALDPPRTFPGATGQAYSQVKVFGLADTVSFRVGTRLAFRYQEVPSAQQTPWLTPYERYAVPAFAPGYTAHPELLLFDVSLL
jgi:hypothetical protein